MLSELFELLLLLLPWEGALLRPWLLLWVLAAGALLRPWLLLWVLAAGTLLRPWLLWVLVAGADDLWDTEVVDFCDTDSLEGALCTVDCDLVSPASELLCTVDCDLVAAGCELL